MATIEKLEGGAELCGWFGGVPSFHDATLKVLELRQGGPSRLVAYTFKMGSTVDAEGYFIQTKKVTVTLVIHGLIEVELYEFMEASIMDGLDIAIEDDGTTLEFDASYGVHGRIKAKRIAVTFEPDV